MVAWLRWLYDVCCQIHIYPEKASFCVLLLCNLLICAHNGIHYDSMVVFVCLHITLPHYHHYADLSEGNELLKCLSGTFCLELECVSKIKTILSTSFHPIYGAVCIQLTHLFYDDCENTCTLSHTYNGNIVYGSIYNTCPCCPEGHIILNNDEKALWRIISYLHLLIYHNMQFGLDSLAFWQASI